MKRALTAMLLGAISVAALAQNTPVGLWRSTDDKTGEVKAKKAEGQGVWEGGKILDPENGKNYTLKMTPVEDGKKLDVRGSFGPFGRTQTWVRIQ